MQLCPDGGYPIRLSRVLPEADWIGENDIITCCQRDSRRVQPGDLFVAIEGTDRDGHDCIVEAVRRGASAVVVNRPISSLDVPNVPICRVRDTRVAYGRICHALAGNPGHQLKIIGVTGTNGKTTTSCLIASILRAAGHDVGLIGTLGCFDGEDVRETSHTTPPPDVLAAAMARMVRNGLTHVVLEVSSHALDQSRLAGVTLDVACVTNVRRDHLDYHHTINDYRLSKSRILNYLSGQGCLVLNADDSTCVSYLQQVNLPVLTVGIHSVAEVTAWPIEQHPSEQMFTITAGSETVPVRTQMIGKHHIYNCLSSVGVGLAHGIELSTAVRGLEVVGHLPGRLERIECGQPFGLFVDYAHTPDALSGSLRALREVTPGRLICVFGAGGDRDQQKRPIMARAVESEADQIVITTDNPRTENPHTIASDLLAGFSRPNEVEMILDRAEAIAFALSIAEPDDCVLVAGKGHEKYQILGTERIPFDDVEIARTWLYDNQPVIV